MSGNLYGMYVHVHVLYMYMNTEKSPNLSYAYRIARIFRGLKFCGFGRSVTIRENSNPRIPGVCEWNHTVLAKSGRSLGVDATAKILSVKIQKLLYVEI